MRDDFQLGTKRIIALRVGYQCSNPTCGAKTAGPQIDPAKAANIGVAAHIMAASPGGPRYDPRASQKARKSPENGIWLCQNCAKLIDSDATRFTEPLLRNWKRIAEQRAMQELGERSPFDRTWAPVLEISPPSGARWTAAVPEPLSADAIEHLSALLLQKNCDGKQIELLASGRGYMDQRYAVIGLGENHGWDWSIGLLTGGEFGWEVIAKIQMESQKGCIPEALYIPGTPGALVITHVDGWGTGVFRRSTSWYRIVKVGTSPLLSYPHNFYIIGWGMPFGRRLTAKPLQLPCRLVNGAPLKLRFDINYTMENEATADEREKDLFSLSQTISVEWNDAASMFAPRTPSDDFASIEEIWREGTEAFGTRNAQVLKHLAQTGTAKQRRFISEYFSL